MTEHFDLVAAVLRKEHPEDSRLDNCDAAFVCNVYLTNNKQRDAIARKLGFKSRCDICGKSCKGGMLTPGQMCRSGLIEWLEEK